jgi:DNA mismatch repair ATPase MutS
MGCFVPATYALIPIRDKILTRIGNNDDIEHNMSTFSVEMKETSYIVDNCTAKSLVLIDELGRGSSNIDGMNVFILSKNDLDCRFTLNFIGLSLALAISEDLLRSRALVLFTTHFSQLTMLEKLYPNVKTVHVKASLTLDDRAPKRNIHFTHQITPGPCKLANGYGIVLAEMCGFPREVVDHARSVRSQIVDKLSLSVKTNPLGGKDMPKVDSRKKAILEQAAVILEAAKPHNGRGGFSKTLAQLAALITPEDKL